MSNPNQNKPGGKPGQRSRKQVQELSPKTAQPESQKPEHELNQTPLPAPSQMPAQPQGAKPEPQDGKEQIAAIVAPANTLAIDFQTIATAYSDYSKKWFEQTKAYFEKLAGVRSLDKAIEIQTEFAKQAYETFVTDSQKIRGLYSGLASQSFKPFEGLVAKAFPAAS
jgi:Phasin protein